MSQALPPLLPAPRHIRQRPGRFLLRDDTALVLAPDAGDGSFAAARAFRDAVAHRCGVRLAIETHAHRRNLGPHISLNAPWREGGGGEAYRIEVKPEIVELAADGPAGLRYATETLSQLVGARRSLPACEIRDQPDLALRGIMLDVSRGKVPTRSSVQELIDVCVRLKLNLLMLYTEHTFRFRRHPAIGEGSSPFDAEDMRELDAYAAERHIDLVPTLQSLGHMRKVLDTPRYRHLDESDRRWTLSPSDPGTYELLRDLYDEYLPNFRSGFFNANCDEPWDLGRGRSKARAERIGRGGLFLEHVRRVRDLARSHGKQTMIWADVVHQHPEQIPCIDRDLIMLDWGYEAEADYDRLGTLRENGLEFLVCPGTSSWNSLFPRVGNSLTNISRWAEAARQYGARGMICTDWGDGGHYNLLGGSWLAFAWAAQQAWSGDVDRSRFDRAFGRVLFDEGNGAAARLYRDLGEIHDVGAETPNASPLQRLYFDELGDESFASTTRPALLHRSLARLRRARERIDAAEQAFGDDFRTRDELIWAADASLCAVAKGLVAHEWKDLRAKPGAGSARQRRRLAKRLRQLAAEQVALTRRLHRLWLARSRPSNFEITRSRVNASTRALRRAATRLERR